MAHYAYYGGSFDPVHRGHLNTALSLLSATKSLKGDNALKSRLIPISSFLNSENLKAPDLSGQAATACACDQATATECTCAPAPASVPAHESARAQEDAVIAPIDTLFLMPNAAPPHKNSVKTDFNLRVGILNSALTEKEYAYLGPLVKVSTLENESAHNNYTYDTLKYLKEQNPDATLSFVMGMDSLKTLHTWKNGLELIDFANILVLKRPHYDLCDLNVKTKEAILYHQAKLTKGLGPEACKGLDQSSAAYQVSGHRQFNQYLLVDGPQFDFSSTEIRKNVQLLYLFYDFFSEKVESFGSLLNSSELSSLKAIKALPKELMLSFFESKIKELSSLLLNDENSSKNELSWYLSKWDEALFFLERALLPSTISHIIKHRLYK